MKKPTTTKKSQTDWVRLNAMSDTDIDLSDSAEITPELFAKAVVRRGLKPVSHKSQLTLRLDSDVLIWFKSQGRGYQTRINDALRQVMEERLTKSSSGRS